jgi:hypothetical protein
MNEGNLLETMQQKRMMEQMQITWEDIEIGEEQFGFNDLSLERFRQDLLAELKKQHDFYQKMPCGVYSGFVRVADSLPKSGVIALMGYPAKKTGRDDSRYEKYELVYTDWAGNSVLGNQKEILEGLSQAIQQKPARQLPDGVDMGVPEAIEPLSQALRRWVRKQGVEETVEADGAVKLTMGNSLKDMLKKLKQGDKSAVEALKQGEKMENKYQPHHFDLLVWLVVSDSDFATNYTNFH